MVYNYDILNHPDDSNNQHLFWDDIIKKFTNYLDEDELDLIIKTIYFDYTIKEIAKETGQNIFTTASRIRKVKAKLRKYYNEQEGEFYE